MSRKVAVFDPFRMMNDDFFGENFIASNTNTGSLDLSEDEQNVYIDLIATGFNKDDINISVEENQVIITGNMKEETTEENKKFYQKEIKQQSFTRSVSLPAKIRSDEIKASIKNGILKIILPKAEEAKPKKIQISVED